VNFLTHSKKTQEKRMKSRVWMWMTVVYLFAGLAMRVGMAAQDNPSQDHKSKHHQYKLIELGTFGGPSSSVPGPSVKIVNVRRTMIGEGDTPTSDLPDCFFGDCFIQHAFTWQDGVITDLGALPGVNSSAPNWINDSGVIVGVSENGLTDPLVGGPEINAVVWKNGQIINLGTLGGNQSFGFSINNRGQAVGVALNAISDPFSLFGLGTQTRAFLSQNGVMQDLGTLGGPDAQPQNVNERGQVCGNSYTSSIPNPTTGIPTLDPFLWERGRMIDLGTLGGTIGACFYLNDRGQVAGTSNLAGDLTFHPFLWSEGVLTDLGTLGGNTGQPNWLNDNGAVIGRADLPGNQIHHGFLWSNGNMTDLGTVGSDPCSVANTINSRGQIVGSSTTCQSGLHAFIWEDGGPMADLNTLVNPGSGLQLISAAYISDRGEITGDGVLPNGDTRAFLLIPCDEKHPGECEDYSMIEGPTPQTSAFAATMKQDSESPISPAERFRSMMPR
jgi:probable HAF family extracellular repeat protein